MDRSSVASPSNLAQARICSLHIASSLRLTWLTISTKRHVEWKSVTHMYVLSLEHATYNENCIHTAVEALKQHEQLLLYSIKFLMIE